MNLGATEALATAVTAPTTATTASATALAALGQQYAYPVCTLVQAQAAATDFDVIPFVECARRRCVPVRSGSGSLDVLFDDPRDETLLAWLDARLASQACTLRLMLPDDLTALLAQLERNVTALDTMGAADGLAIDETEHVESLDMASIGQEDAQAVRLVRSTLRDAIQAGASDIHFETLSAGLTIKFRIDGLLAQVKNIPDRTLAEHAIARIKVLADLDITERRVPQDGRFKALHLNRHIDFRVSIMPSIFGEDSVVRVLDRESFRDKLKSFTLESLGFAGAPLAELRSLSRQPYGMLLVTGPTGSGKTTTLYAMLSEINTGTEKLVTIEDPVEYQLAGVLQIPVNERKGLTFARGLRSLLRHDPDKIMVGEIRDPETASIAVQSALTGHLVFTTVHANNVFDVIGRFSHMGIDLHGFVAALNGVLAQRLVRQLCPACAQPHTPDEEESASAGIPLAAMRDFRFMRAVGCAECRGAGYRGRTVISELISLDDEFRDLIVRRASGAELKALARQRGMVFLRESALALVRQGRTTLSEINRVTFSC